MNNLIVAYDFKSAGDKALAYAKSLIKDDDGKITLLYIANDENDAKNATTQFQPLLSQSSPIIEAKAVVGNLIEDLANTAIKLNGSQVVMAIYGESGLQKVFGSRAINVITDSRIPFLITQSELDTTNDSSIKTLAMTMDFNEESTQVLNASVELCEKFGAELILVAGDNPDTSKKEKIDANVSKISKELDTTGISYRVVYLPTTNFEEGLIQFAEDNKVDALAVTYYQDNSSLFSANHFVQKLLENKAGIPVLTIGGKEKPAFEKFFSNMVCPFSIEKIDSNISRTTIFINVLIMIAFLVTYNPIFAYIVAADYFIRAAISGKYSPIRFVAEKLVKAANLKPKRISLAPKVFASRLGFLCAAAAIVFFYSDVYIGSIISMGMLAVLSFMDSVLNFCVGCLIYYYLVYPLFKFRS